MARSGKPGRGSRPAGRGTGGRSRPPGPPGRPPKLPGHGKGTTHKSSSVEGTPMIGLVYGIAAAVVLTMGSVVGYLLHGYGAV